MCNVRNGNQQTTYTGLHKKSLQFSNSHTHTHTHTRTHTHTHLHPHALTHIRTQPQTRAHSRYTATHPHAHTHTNARNHTHTLDTLNGISKRCREKRSTSVPPADTSGWPWRWEGGNANNRLLQSSPERASLSRSDTETHTEDIYLFHYSFFNDFILSVFVCLTVWQKLVLCPVCVGPARVWAF